MKRRLIFIAVLVFVAACQQLPQQQDAKPPVIEVNNSQQQMDMLERLFNNDNWMKIVNHDTSYYYFSRNQATMKVYHYKLNKGDSTNTVLSEIQVLNDSLQWKNGEVLLQLTHIDSTIATWKNLKDTAQTNATTFQKQTGNRLKIIEGEERYTLVRTLPLATFLIRSHYDFLHGTTFAFTDTIFQPARAK